MYTDLYCPLWVTVVAGLGIASCQRDQAKLKLSSNGIVNGEITKYYKDSELRKDCQYNIISTKYSCSVETSALGLEIYCGQKNIKDFDNGCFPVDV